MAVILALRRWKQEDCGFKDHSLVYMAEFSTIPDDLFSFQHPYQAALQHLQEIQWPSGHNNSIHAMHIFIHIDV